MAGHMGLEPKMRQKRQCKKGVSIPLGSCYRLGCCGINTQFKLHRYVRNTKC